MKSQNLQKWFDGVVVHKTIPNPPESISILPESGSKFNFTFNISDIFTLHNIIQIQTSKAPFMLPAYANRI